MAVVTTNRKSGRDQQMQIGSKKRQRTDHHSGAIRAAGKSKFDPSRKRVRALSNWCGVKDTIPKWSPRGGRREVKREGSARLRKIAEPISSSKPQCFRLPRCGRHSSSRTDSRPVIANGGRLCPGGNQRNNWHILAPSWRRGQRACRRTACATARGQLSICH